MRGKITYQLDFVYVVISMKLESCNKHMTAGIWSVITHSGSTDIKEAAGGRDGVVGRVKVR